MSDFPFYPGPFIQLLSLPAWLLLAMLLGTGVLWLLSGHRTRLRKASAMAFGGAVALGLFNLLPLLFFVGRTIR